MLALAQLLPAEYEIILAGAVSFADQLPSNIKSVGYISSADDLAKLYSACDVYVHLSREDTFGKVIAEAISCGTPAVVYDSTACPEVLGEGCGYVVPAGDVEAIRKAIETICGIPKSEFHKCCIKHAAEHFSKEKLLNDTLDLYIRLTKIDED